MLQIKSVHPKIFQLLKNLSSAGNLQDFALASFRKHCQQNLIDRRKLTGLRNLLGQAVKDNILYYDPVEGAYGVQGKSLEWAIKGYFEY